MNDRQIGRPGSIVKAPSSFVLAVDRYRSTHPMLTPEADTVLLIALVVNALIVAGLIVAPRVRNWWRRRSAGPPIAKGVSTSGRPGRAAADAGQPWFVTPSPNGAANGAASGDRARIVLASVSMPALASPSSWATWLEEEAARAVRYERPATIVLVELAGLDRLADRVGVAAADRLIPPVASTIRRHARAADRLARLSATRFGVLLVETDEVSAINYIERIRSNCDVWLAAGAVSLRLSAGWAEIRPDRGAEAALREAEQRLFDDRRRSESAEPASQAGEHDGRSAVLQTSGT
jgi:diguanylate cyclase (GGDEF)-like protein